jgi:hypothetical protein
MVPFTSMHRHLISNKRSPYLSHQWIADVSPMNCQLRAIGCISIGDDRSLLMPFSPMNHHFRRWCHYTPRHKLSLLILIFTSPFDGAIVNFHHLNGTSGDQWRSQLMPMAIIGVNEPIRCAIGCIIIGYNSTMDRRW